MDPMIFKYIGETVTNATDVFVQPAAQSLMLSLKWLVVTGVTLYITLTGYAISTGAVEVPMWTFVKQCLKIIIIAALALTVDGYIIGVTGAIDGLETGLIQGMSSSLSPVSIYEVLDKSVGKGFEIVILCFQKADEAGWSFGSVISWSVTGLIVFAGTVLVSLLGGGVIIVAKFSLAVMLAVGPLFIVSLMFPITARFFDSWFSQVMNYVMTIVIMAFVMTFTMKAFDSFIAQADFSGGGEFNPMFSALQIGVLTGLLCWIILQATGMASGLAGGISSSVMGIRHLVSPVTSSIETARGAGNRLNPMSTRRDMQSGMMTTARRGNHLVAGNTMWNPAYRQHVISNMGKNWGHATGGSAKAKQSSSGGFVKNKP
ncbi:MAG: type IV secretion system protein [Proteobacteria bacterium]|nr:MAG: type IV secretion system protein [Pseudomonadota bacterium]